MNCPNCGAQTYGEAIVCKQCNQFIPQHPRQPHGPIPVTSKSKEHIPNYLIFSIFVCLCCCLPFGIAGIVYASQVNAKIARGDLVGARESSDKALKWSTIGVIIGLVGVVFYLVAGGRHVTGQ